MYTSKECKMRNPRFCNHRNGIRIRYSPLNKVQSIICILTYTIRTHSFRIKLTSYKIYVKNTA